MWICFETRSPTDMTEQFTECPTYSPPTLSETGNVSLALFNPIDNSQLNRSIACWKKTVWSTRGSVLSHCRQTGRRRVGTTASTACQHNVDPVLCQRRGRWHSSGSTLGWYLLIRLLASVSCQTCSHTVSIATNVKKKDRQWKDPCQTRKKINWTKLGDCFSKVLFDVSSPKNA